MAETPAETPFAVTWEAELTRPRPFLCNAFHGEAFRLVCHPRQGGKALVGLSGAAVRLRWQSAGMDAGAWYAKAGAYDPATGAVSAVWDAACDDGGDDVRFFLAIETAGGVSFRVHGALRLAPSPGFTPAAPLPESVAAELRAAIAAEQATREQADEEEADARKQADDGLAQALTAEQTARAKADETLRAAIDAHAGRADNPHAVTAAQVGALTEGSADDRYPRFRDETGTTTVGGGNHGRNVMASQNGQNGGFYVGGAAGAPPSRKKWLTQYQRNRVRVYGATTGEARDYHWDASETEKADLLVQRARDVAETLAAHDASADAHADIRRAIEGLSADDIDTGAPGTRVFDTAAGADSWGTAWGVALNLATLDPDGGALPGADVRVASITLRTAASSFTARTVRLLLRADDGTETTSANAVAPTATSQEMAFAFAGDGAPLPGGTGELFFADEDAGGDLVPVALRILAVGEQPEGNAIITASSGTRRADLFPELRVEYTVQGTVKDALDALASAVAGGVAKTGADNDFAGANRFRGIARMANPRISAAPDDATKDIALVPNANGAGLQLQFPGGNTAMIRSKTGVLATTAEVAAKQDALTAGENISIQDGVISSTAEVAISPYGGLGIGENGLSIVGQDDGQGNVSFGADLMFMYQQSGKVLGVYLHDISSVPFNLTTTEYVDGLVGDIDAALAQI